MKLAIVLVLILLPNSCFSQNCSLSDLVNQIRPNSEWNVRGNQLEWLDTSQLQPSSKELSDAFSVCQSSAVSIRKQLQNDLFNLQLSTNTVVQKLPALLDLLKLKGLLQ